MINQYTYTEYHSNWQEGSKKVLKNCGSGIYSEVSKLQKAIV